MAGQSNKTAIGKSGPQEDYFAQDVAQIKPVHWVSVALMCIGFALVGVGVALLRTDLTLVWIFAAIGTVVGLVGSVLAFTHRLMDSAH